MKTKFNIVDITVRTGVQNDIFHIKVAELVFQVNETQEELIEAANNNSKKRFDVSFVNGTYNGYMSLEMGVGWVHNNSILCFYDKNCNNYITEVKKLNA